MYTYTFTTEHPVYNNQLHSHNYISYTLNIELVDLINKVAEIGQQATKPFKKLSWLNSLIPTTKKGWCTAGIASLYAYLHYEIISLKWYLKQKKLWSAWPYPTTTLESLFETPRPMLEKDLLAAIQNRYFAAHDPTNFETPYILFLQDLQKEEKALIRYQRIVQTIQKLYLSAITWHDKQLSEATTERLQKLRYLKSIFSAWMTENKLQKTGFIKKNR